jgi:hypothetical protein
MKIRKYLVPTAAAAAIAIAGAAAFALPASAAVSVQSQSPATGVVKFAKTATLKANGAAVVIKVSGACLGHGTTAGLSISLSETVGKTVITGGAYIDNLPCDGKIHTYKLSVIPTGKPFKAGVAYGKANINFCYDNCYDAYAQHQVTIG